MHTQLNPAQEQAVQHVNGPLLVLAGAGSGKTRVVVHRIAHLLELNIPPSAILAVTFTNKAADEMRRRIYAMKNAHVLASTFHSLGARILRESIEPLGFQPTFIIYDEEDSEKLLKAAIKELNIAEEKGFLAKVRHHISTAKNNLIDPGDDREYGSIYQLYQQKLKSCNALDFDDLLYLTVRLFREFPEILAIYQNRWRFLLIDEYQDTNISQYMLAKLLVAAHQNLFAVGDPDQSIYSWRGARYQNILNFEQDFPGAKVITLDQNYRSTNIILQAANALIGHNENRYDKKLWSALGQGAKIKSHTAHNEREEAEFVAWQVEKSAIALDHAAIFYRTNAQSRPFEDALLSRRIPYRIIGGISFYQRKEIKDILAFLKLLISDADLISFLRIINLPKRGLGSSSLEKIIHLATTRQVPIFTFCEELLHHPEWLKLSSKQHAGLTDFVQMIRTLRAKVKTLKLHELISEAVSLSRYLAYLQEDAETFQERKENVDELIGKAAEWEQTHEGLSTFLEELSLRTTVETDPSIPSLSLMTLHNSKGLEFDLVFLVGLEEDLLPHVNSKDNPEAIEEERRLCYVGMTRAKKELYLSSAIYRFMWGTARFMRPSRFLKEIPLQYLLQV